MNNLSEFKDFSKSTNKNKVNENAQLIDDVWVVRPRIEVSSKLINDYFKKVKNETGVDVSKRTSEQFMAEDIAAYLSTFLTIENIPVSLVTGNSTAPKTQTEMPAQTQVQGDVAQPVQGTDAPVQGTDATPVQTPAPAQTAPAQTAPAQTAPAQSAQAASNQIPQNEI